MISDVQNTKLILCLRGIEKGYESARILGIKARQDDKMLCSKEKKRALPVVTLKH